MSENAHERKVFLSQMRILFNELPLLWDKKDKMVKMQKIYDFILEHRSIAYRFTNFYNTCIIKLHEFIEQNAAPEFTTYCIAILSALFLDNTAPRNSLAPELEIRSREILDLSVPTCNLLKT